MSRSRDAESPERSATVKGRAVRARLAVMMFLHYFTMGAWIVTLTTFVLALRNLRDPGKSFGGVRLWGTVGWIAAGFAVGPLMLPPSPKPLYLGAAAVFAQGLYALTLPHTPPKGRSSSIAEVVGLPALT